MSITTLALTADVPALDEACGWANFESWLVAMREELPAAVLAQALDEAQERLIDSVCGPKWMPTRGLPAPFACPRCQAGEDFARKGRRTRPRKIHTATGVVELRLWNVGCRECGRVFAPLLFMLGLHNKRRTDRLTVDLAELGLQMSFHRAATISTRLGVPATAGQTHHALADVAGLLAPHGTVAAAHPEQPAAVVLIDGTGVRAGTRRLGTDCNIVLGVDARRGPARRRRADVRLLAAGVDQRWHGIEEQLRPLPPPRLVVLDGEVAITEMVRRVWPRVPIQRCWWHLPRGLRQALYSDGFTNPHVKDTVNEFAGLLRDTMAFELARDEALDAYDGFMRTVTTPQAARYLLEARPHAFTCLDAELRRSLGRLGGPELGTGVLERRMREINARTDIGGSRWSVAGLNDLINLLLAKTTKHPAWQSLWRETHQPNAIPFHLAKFNAC
jgi:hypothetical protein